MHLVPTEKLQANTAEGQALRRKILRGSIVIFVGAGGKLKRETFVRAKELGVHTVIVESEDSWSKCLVEENIIRKFVAMDMNDPEALFTSLLKAIDDVSEECGGVDAVTTFCEVATPLVARVCAALNLPGNSPEAVDLARDKHAARQALKDAGLPSPGFALLETAEDLKPAAESVGFPAVIKPVSGAASLGVVRVDSFDELEAAYHRVVSEMRRYRVTSGALVAGAVVDDEDAADPDGNAAMWVKPRIVMEEYLDGIEVDIDCVMSEGECYYNKVTDNWATREPYFNETGSNCPSRLPAGQVEELVALGVNSCKALGFTMGAFHVEAKYTSRGPRLVEINPRMGGGPVYSVNLKCWGVCLVEEQMLTSVGIPARPQAPEKPLVQLAEYALNAVRSGVITDLSCCDEWAKQPGVVYIRPLVKVGDVVCGGGDGLPTWLINMMVVRDTVDEACDFMQNMVAEMERQVGIEPVASK